VAEKDVGNYGIYILGRKEDEERRGKKRKK